MIVLSGPCVMESERFTLDVAKDLFGQFKGLPIDFVFKASFDKANRTSVEGFRGPGLQEGLKILEKVKSEFKIPVLTDVHSVDQVDAVTSVADVVQIPAFLCRQTDLVIAASRAAFQKKKRLNIKKGQFLAPWDAKNIVEKVRAVTSPDFPLMITERGVSFGYNTLVVDMIAFQVLKSMGATSIYDATHSIQVPGMAPGGKSTGGKREYLESLARGSMAAGADGLFFEVHPDPKNAKSDGPNALYLDKARKFVEQCLEIKNLVSKLPKLLPESQ